MASIAIIDYGMGNLRSVAKALEQVAPQARVFVTQNCHDILHADRVVFPGQGSIRDCMRELARWDLIEVVQDAARSKPFLGLCLGPQALLDFSEENGGVECLKVLPGRVIWFSELHDPVSGERLKVPHMGWNQVHQVRSHPLWAGIAQDSRFYFVHSYYLQPADEALVAGCTRYGFDFASAIARDNLFAVQFHPEKSAQAGLRLLANFAAWRP
ncbi:MAG TPA: imidazole glycerol phosphate synthase subunit HisH [Candidatus Competibacteraceae bacterium]|nr:imidazole glycerol phosphate synthase subunit HisH [Candidatus Competibacteraceae bacterium]HRZ05155.1 imidazole glycerol phosphate synthase subunit HisH [Candidatus Competibacteraceae bacterium]HSA46115.1 imidazole glycerol phosphate synthase subunit HisH [Candidatus Competibacteraceae bacterium]